MTTLRSHQGQPFRHVGEHPHTTREGRAMTLEIWESECERCGVGYAVSVIAGREPFAPTRRCVEHRRIRHRSPAKGTA